MTIYMLLTFSETRLSHSLTTHKITRAALMMMTMMMIIKTNQTVFKPTLLDHEQNHCLKHHRKLLSRAVEGFFLLTYKVIKYGEIPLFKIIFNYICVFSDY